MRWLVAIQIAMLCPAQAQTREAPVKIPPVKTSIDFGGRAIEITAWGTLAGSSGVYALSLTVDLSELQKNLTAILGSEINRSEKCGERISVQEGAMIIPEQPSAVVTANVNYERYACAKAFGKEIVKKLVGGRGTIEVKLTPQVADNNLSLDAEVRKLDADGSLGDVLRSGAAGDSIRQDISDSIESAIQKAADLKTSLPPALQNAVTIQSVRFADGGSGRLWLAIAGEAHISAEELRYAVGQ
jgi:hypothetical protein